MNIFDRIRFLFTEPRKEWGKVAKEQLPVKDVLLKYILPLVMIPTLSILIGWGLVGKINSDGWLSVTIKGWDVGSSKALIYLMSSVSSVFLSALIIDYIAPIFKSEINFACSFRLVAYAWTPIWVAGIFNIIPSLSFMGILAFGYALVLLYFGVDATKKTPAESRTPYAVGGIAIMIGCYALIYLIVNSFIGSIWINQAALLQGKFVF